MDIFFGRKSNLNLDSDGIDYLFRNFVIPMVILAIAGFVLIGGLLGLLIGWLIL